MAADTSARKGGLILTDKAIDPTVAGEILRNKEELKPYLENAVQKLVPLRFPGVHPGLNQLRNPSFEVDANGVTPPTGWTIHAGTAVVDTSQYYDGAKSCLIAAASPINSRFYQTVNIKKGQYVRVSIACKASTALHAGVHIEFNGGDYSWYIVYGTKHTGGGAWEILSVVFGAVTSDTTVYVVAKKATATATDIWFDHAVLEVFDAPIFPISTFNGVNLTDKATNPTVAGEILRNGDTIQALKIYLAGAVQTVVVKDLLAALDINVGLSKAYPIFLLNSPTPDWRIIDFATNNVLRWRVLVNNTAESGSNVGSNFEIRRRADDGSALGSAIIINRATGLVTLENGLTLTAGNIIVPGTVDGRDVSVDGAALDKLAPEDWTDYGATSTVVGWAATPTVNIWYKCVGKLVFVNFRITGVSNAVTATFTLPYATKNSTNYYTETAIRAIDNGVVFATPGLLRLAPNSNVVYLYTDWQEVTWTASGTKTVIGQFWYEKA